MLVVTGREELNIMVNGDLFEVSKTVNKLPANYRHVYLVTDHCIRYWARTDGSVNSCLTL